MAHAIRSLDNARRPKLHDMKIPKKDKGKNLVEAPSIGEAGGYPWGLRLDLDKDQIDKLGISLPDVGDKFVIVATGVVESVSENKNSHRKHQNVQIQIHKLGLSKPKEA